jgi:hypothetical protein
MHSDCGGSEGVVGWEDESAPVLSIVVGRCWRAGDNVVPSIHFVSRRVHAEDKAREGRTLGCSTPRGERRCMEEGSRKWFCIRGSTVLTVRYIYHRTRRQRTRLLAARLAIVAVSRLKPRCGFLNASAKERRGSTSNFIGARE